MSLLIRGSNDWIRQKIQTKKIRGFKNSDNEYYKVIGFYKFDTVICENAYGERFVFMKKFLIDPQKPDEIYSDLMLERKEWWQKKTMHSMEQRF